MSCSFKFVMEITFNDIFQEILFQIPSISIDQDKND